jgi:arylformamidase
MPIDYEAEYNNSRRVADSAAFGPRWQAASAALRARVKTELARPYGPDARQHYDILWPDAAGAQTPIAVYIHGGYWQGRDRADFSCVAEGLLARGVACALPSYRLAPTVRIADIIADMRAFLVALYTHTGRRAVVTGHSAGGHLTGAMLATDWSQIAGVPADLVRAGYAISGVFDVAPLLTTSIGVALHETVASARAISPQFWRPPSKNVWLTAAVGAAESPEFIRQSADFAGVWSAAGIAAECVLIPGANHFSILDDLMRPDSAMVQRIADLAARSASV